MESSSWLTLFPPTGRQYVYSRCRWETVCTVSVFLFSWGKVCPKCRCSPFNRTDRHDHIPMCWTPWTDFLRHFEIVFIIKLIKLYFRLGKTTFIDTEPEDLGLVALISGVLKHHERKDFKTLFFISPEGPMKPFCWLSMRQCTSTETSSLY